MRFMITAAPATDAPRAVAEGEAPFDEALFAAYMKYNEELARAGVLITSEGLNPAVRGARVGIKGGKRTVLDGPFTESKELLGGFYLIEVASRDEAIAWALRCPVGFGHAEVLTIHQMVLMEDIPPHLQAIITEVAPTWVASIARRR